MNGRTAYVTHSDCSRHDTGWRHPEHQGRLPAIARAVHRDMLTLFDHLLEVEGVPATDDQLRLAHSADYIARVEARCREAAAAGEVLELEGEVVVSGASCDAVRAAVGCALTAVEQVLAGDARNAFCAVRPPGHGAGPDAPGGFGIFNTVAVAALHLIRRTDRRVLVVEWGSDPGVGTARILGAEPAARMLSLHLGEEPGWLAEAGPSVLARSLLRGSGGGEMLAALREGWDEAVDGFQPDFVLLSLGCDALEGDPRGGLSLTPSDFFDLTASLRERAESACGGRLVSVLEGGYDADASARAVVQHLRALASLAPHSA